MATKLLNREGWLDNIRQFTVFDDFIQYDTGDFLWTDDASDASATIAIDADGVGGVLQMTVDTTDNEEAYFYTTNELFKIAADKPLFAICRFKIDAESSINASAMLWGVINGVAAADNIVDATGAPAASKQGALMGKAVDSGDVVCYAHTTGASGGYVADNKKTTDQDMVDNTWVTQAILIEPVSGADKRVTFYHDSAGGVNLQQCKDTDGNLIKIKQTLAAASDTELALFIGIKNASTDAQVLNIDYIGAIQLR